MLTQRRVLESFPQLHKIGVFKQARLFQGLVGRAAARVLRGLALDDRPGRDDVVELGGLARDVAVGLELVAERARRGG